MLLPFLTMLGYIVTVVVGGISIFEFIKRGTQHPRKTAKIFALVAIGMLLISLVLTGLTATQTNGDKLVTATSTASATALENTTPTQVATPTDTPIPTQAPTPTEPTATSTPIKEGAVTLPENITLECDCSDPVVVTITKIQIQPQQNRMIWFLTFSNNSQNSADATFRQFYLEKGDQVNYPTTGDQTIYYATGEAVSTGVSLQAGETQQTTLTFSFVPYKDIPYTLSSDLGGLFNGVLAYNVPFKPKVIQFP